MTFPKNRTYTVCPEFVETQINRHVGKTLATHKHNSAATHATHTIPIISPDYHYRNKELCRMPWQMAKVCLADDKGLCRQPADNKEAFVVDWSAGHVAVYWLTTKVFVVRYACLCRQPWLTAMFLILVVIQV